MTQPRANTLNKHFSCSVPLDDGIELRGRNLWDPPPHKNNFSVNKELDGLLKKS